MYQTFRDSFIRQIIYFASGRKLLQHPEERPGFVVPDKYRPREKQARSPNTASLSDAGADGVGPVEKRRPVDAGAGATAAAPGAGAAPGAAGRDVETQSTSRESEASDRTVVEGNAPLSEEDGNIVTWYGPDDPENPKNWSLLKKCWVTLAIMLMTSSVYMGSSIYSPAITQTMTYFGLGQVPATLGLSLFVVGYGVGPLFLAPITEIPAVGRTAPYIITLAIFCVLQVPTALVTNFAGFAILRFLAGFIGSPPLATGGASLQDIFSPHKLPYAMGLYGLSAASAPALAPIISGFATSTNNILLRRAQRLRRLTGNQNLRSHSEIQQGEMTGGEIVRMTLVRPFSMTFTEPIVLAINVYIGLIYAVLYSYFESFPIVYVEGYGWSLGVADLPFAALLVGSFISYTGFCLWNRFYFEPQFFKAQGKVKPETRLPMSMAGAFAFPICLFWFAWTANRTHWVSPLIASSFFGIGATWMFMPFLTYLPHAYPEFAASVLASNDFFRSMMGAGMPLVAVPMFGNLGIDWGNTLLGCLTVLFIPIPFVLFKYGPWLRARSPRSLHDEDIDNMPPDDAAVREHNADQVV
ncbi:Caffeine resistance protein 5 [Saitozyma sp. JCM 24511]|nr:Caffeine resistance protein 5 [Saitozyma sp. JCM 24511]